MQVMQQNTPGKKYFSLQDQNQYILTSDASRGLCSLGRFGLVEQHHVAESLTIGPVFIISLDIFYNKPCYLWS